MVIQINTENRREKNRNEEIRIEKMNEYCSSESIQSLFSFLISIVCHIEWIFSIHSGLVIY